MATTQASTMAGLLTWLQKHLVWSIPGAMLLGLGAGALTDAGLLRWAILPLTFLMVYPMMVTLNLRALAAPGGQRLQGTVLAINFVLMPFVGWGIGLWFLRRGLEGEAHPIHVALAREVLALGLGRHPHAAEESASSEPNSKLAWVRSMPTLRSALARSTWARPVR